MMPCGSCGGSTVRRSFRAPTNAQGQPSDAAAAAAASLTEYEVIDSRGTPTNRRFTSLVAASGYARNIGGTTRPV